MAQGTIDLLTFHQKTFQHIVNLFIGLFIWIPQIWPLLLLRLSCCRCRRVSGRPPCSVIGQAPAPAAPAARVPCCPCRRKPKLPELRKLKRRKLKLKRS